MSKSGIFILILASYGLITSSAHAIFSPEAQVTIKVIDEQGKPIDGANVKANFEVPDMSRGGIKHISVEGFTNNDGIYSAVGKTSDRVACLVVKDGYYKSGSVYKFKDVKQNKWLPWNPTIELVLKKIENPVLMYKKETQMSRPRLMLPVIGKEVGFDLIKYDWLPPFGNGSVADFIFKLEKRFTGLEDYEGELTITFSNKFDGIQLHKEDRKHGSTFKLPRFAPLEGYSNKLVLETKQVPGKPVKNDFQEDNNYFFRVRSEVEDGKLVKAMYGKIAGPIVFRRFMKNDAQLNFTYYLNPDYTRNMEFGSNLFPNE